MSNSSYSSDSVVDKSEEKVSVIVIYFNSVFYKLVHNFVCHIFNFFISKYGMTDSSNSTDCMMSNSSYSSDSVVDKSKDKIFFCLITEYGMTESSNSTNCVMSNSSYSSDSVMDKSKDEISVFFVVFNICLFKKFICKFFGQFVSFFISIYDCSMDIMVGEPKQKIFVFYCLFVLCNSFRH